MNWLLARMTHMQFAVLMTVVSWLAIGGGIFVAYQFLVIAE